HGRPLLPWAFRASSLSPVRRCFLLVTGRPPSPTLFPYTTLFRSRSAICASWVASERWAVSSGSSSGANRFSAGGAAAGVCARERSEEHTSELQSRENLVCRHLLEQKRLRRNLLAKEFSEHRRGKK